MTNSLFTLEFNNSQSEKGVGGIGEFMLLDIVQYIPI